VAEQGEERKTGSSEWPFSVRGGGLRWEKAKKVIGRTKSQQSYITGGMGGKE